MMAINPNESRENRHTIIIGQSESGKTYWLKNHPWVKRRGVRLLVWDPYESHTAHFSRGRAEFARTVAAAVRSGRGFRLGLAVNPSPDAFEFFCRVVWASLDGRRETVVIVEEAADVTKPGKAGPAWGQLIRVGRKYGAVLMVVTQRPQEIDKTLFTQTSRQWCGLVSAYDRAYCEKYLGLDRGTLATIEPRTYRFLYKHGSRIQWGGPKKRVKP